MFTTTARVVMTLLVMISTALCAEDFTIALLVSAHAGDTWAMFALGQRYEFGSGATQDYDKALLWYQAAADAGDARAMNTLALWQIDGINLTKDEPAGQAMLIKAAELDEPAAMMNLATRFENGTEWLAKDPTKFAAYLARAVARYRDLAAAGEPRAMFELGALYAEGRGVPRDDATAAQWFEKAASNNDTAAMLCLANLCAEGRGIKRDNQKIFTLCSKAAELGNPLAMLALASIYDIGVVSPKDAGKAFAWRQRAADLKSPAAMFQIAQQFETGNGVAKDEEQSMRWYRKAAAFGDSAALVELGVRATRENENLEAFSYFERAAKLGNAHAFYNLGWAYAHGRGAVKNEEKAAAEYGKAAEYGHAPAMNNLGLMSMGGLGIPRNEAKAVHWFQQAAALGNTDAMRNLAEAYRTGRGVAMDLSEANKWRRKADETASR